ncbi:citrate-Mg2+:H+ or citrate-Ca2+:H+ symporter, CitMHS family [Peribacillus simplex]|uniref:Citrate-Mg2+:H+ or citrate-Ca2+:H+ symporter, CitMHS family n=1 Tax=Peribacillus simplex TaxID=1478 RepID=A0A9X8WN70_9BACI|nr:citrate:proton symporter [Peribacillus simplex]SIS07718.1 citrate-Mg2+:H+ or citrate-Ca2+:H+ symporter, CitMHS family [Peribacillus simplex]
MIALLGFLMMICFIFFIVTRRMSALTALIVIPLLFAIVGGFGKDLGPMVLEGLMGVAPTGIMLMFAVMYFGIMIEAGLFEPLISKILTIVKGDPLKVVIGTAVLSSLVALDGDGTTTYIITVSAMLPLYIRLGINPLILTCVSMMAFGVMNILPWGGPTARAISALKLDANEVFLPLVPVMLGGFLWVLFTAYVLGKKERKRLGILDLDLSQHFLANQEQASAVEIDLKRPKFIWFNLLLTLSLIVALVLGVLPLPVLFIMAFSLALLVNYPNLEVQKKVLSSHADSVVIVVALIFASGVFTGILSGTHMVDEMANSLISIIPEQLGSSFALITAITSLPLTYVMANDPYYFGVLPIIAKTAAAYGVDPVEVARASVLGQPIHAMSPLIASTHLLVGMAKVDFGKHQKFILKWAVGTCVVMILIALITGAISL